MLIVNIYCVVSKAILIQIRNIIILILHIRKPRLREVEKWPRGNRN